MKIIDGKIPEGRLWRVLVLFSKEQEPGLAWQLGLQLATANGGEIIAGVILPRSLAENARGHAQVTFSRAREMADDDEMVSALLVETDDYHHALVQIIEKGGHATSARLRQWPAATISSSYLMLHMPLAAPTTGK